MLRKNILLYFLYIVSSIILLFGLGYTKNWENKDIIVGFIFLGCYIFGTKYRFTSIILLVTFSVLSFYFPTGIIYGKPTEAILISLIQTNKLEVIGYLMAIKYEIFLSVLFIIIQFFIYQITKKEKYKFKYFTIFAFIFLYIVSLFGISVNHHGINRNAFLKNSIDSWKVIRKQKEEQRINLGDSSAIKIDGKIDNNDDTEIRVVIIGESVRRDYMSVYGYPNNTTPFLNSAKGIFIDGLVSAGPNTQLSLTRTLFKAIPTENKIHWGINVVSLANKAGYETYWISNQGANGWGDDVFYNLSKLATQNKFLKAGDFNSGNNDDEEMLPILEKIINSNAKEKVIFMHMIGSHEPVCSRIGNFTPNFKLHNEAGCYAATIEKLDLFIEKITKILKGKKYKLMYFSDHGLSVEKTEVFHNNNIVEEYEVPLFYLDSDIKEQIHIKKKISGLNLLDIFSSFINIKSNITDSNFNFHQASKLTDNSDPIIYWDEYRPFSTIQKKQPPIIDIQSNIIGDTVKLENNYKFSKECVSYVDSVDVAFPLNKEVYKIYGWAAADKDKKPLDEAIGVFIMKNNQVYFIQGDKQARNGVRDHFNISPGERDDYGIVSFVDKKYVDSIKNTYLGYKDQYNQYHICIRNNQF